MDHGCALCAVTGSGPQEHESAHRAGMATHIVDIERYPHPVKDLVSLLRIWWFLCSNRFDVVHVSTPKASLLGAMAARLSGHARVVYLVRGRAYENMRGWRRAVMSTCEWVTCHLARRVVPICRELGQALVDKRLCPPGKMQFIGSGSDRGVDLEHFAPTAENKGAGLEVRRELGVGEEALVILSVGWLREEKGTNETVRAFVNLAKDYPHLHLFLLGDYEPSDPLDPEVITEIESNDRIHHLARREDPAPVFAAADMLAFPSYREGFGNVAIEASAMELPVVASDIMGCREAVLDGKTGLLVPLGDADSLAAALKQLIDDPSLRRTLATNGRRRVENEFRQELVFEGMRRLFLDLRAT